MNAVVITPTIGEPTLVEAMESVARQTFPVKHIVVVDGVAHQADVMKLVMNSVGKKYVELLVLPRPTGQGKFFGHRAIAASCFTVLEDTIFLLDADNFYQSDHIENCMEALAASGAQWCYGLRDIVDERGRFLLSDDCESLGYWPRAMYYQSKLGWHTADETKFVMENPFLVDTSCYCVSRKAFARYSYAWDNGHGADALFAKKLILNVPGVATGLTTVCYRVTHERWNILEAHFRAGNKNMSALYEGYRPWRQAGNNFVQPPTVLPISLNSYRC